MLQERTEVEKIEVFPNGQLHVYRVTIVTRNGEEIARQTDIEKFEAGATIQPEDKLLKAVAFIGVWSAQERAVSLLAPTSKKGKLYRTRGKDAGQVATLVGPVSKLENVQLGDPRAATIKHRGAEQTSIRPIYAGTAQGFEPPRQERAIKHRGNDQK